MPEEYIQVNTNLTKEDAQMLDWMQKQDALENRSAWVRRLIRQEWARRFSQPNPTLTVDEAISAGSAIEKGKK